MYTYGFSMAFAITFLDETIERVQADAYTIEGALTTFFCVAEGRPPRLDSWATRCMSVRTDRVLAIRLVASNADNTADETTTRSLSLVV
jgi:hypothetical protein